MKKNNQGFIQIILILVVIAMVGGGMYYIDALKNKTNVIVETPTPSPVSSETPVKDETAGWKTYTNKTFGFEMKYPTRWTVIPPTNEAYPEGYILIGGKSKEDLLHLNVIPFVGNTKNLISKYHENPSLFSYTNWGELGKEKEQKTIGNLDVIWFENDITASSSGREINFKVTDILFTNGKLGFLIHTQVNNVDELNQILSTFKFTE